MRPFLYERPADLNAAVAAARSGNSQYLAGGTTLLDLMKLDVMRPGLLVDIGALAGDRPGIEAIPGGVRLGAGVHMTEAATHPLLRRDYPVIVQSLELAASAQLRNMATLGGNVLQRTRCNYFRDTSWKECNKRNPGSGCAARDGVNRKHAVLGTSDDCIAAYPGDFAQALIALDAQVELMGGDGRCEISFESLHRLPGTTPEIETVLEPGELITGFTIPAADWSRRSLFLKVRDRESYEFALASAAVALDLAGDGTVRKARIALGGVATRPWRAREAEAELVGRPLTEDSAEEAARTAFAEARSHGDNDFKIVLGRRTLVRALLQASRLEI